MNTTSGTTPKYLRMNQPTYPVESIQRLRDMREEELMDPETWDFANAVQMPPVKRGRSVLSVAFAAEQFEAIGKAAERRGKKLSAFVREAALRAARR